MSSVWLLIEQQDYEGKEIHSVYLEKPLSQTLYKLLKDSYGYAFSPEVIKKLACKLYSDEKIYFLSLYTWGLEERYVND